MVGSGADLVVDCLCYTAKHARSLLVHRAEIGSAVALSSKAVYVDAAGRHANSDEPPSFEGPVDETQSVLEPAFSGDFARRGGYGAHKVAAERLLVASDLPVSVLRLSRVHGPGGGRPREWFVVRRLFAGRTRIPLAHGGATGNHPTAAANLARLVELCARHPGSRVLNVADPGKPTAADVVRAVPDAFGTPVEIVGLPEDAPAGLGGSPWSTWPPFFLDTSAARELGWVPAGTYAETVTAQVDALRPRTAGAEGARCRSIFP